MRTVDSPSNAPTPAARPSVSGIVLAGTHQWSRSSFEALRPRPLLPVAQKPLIDYVLGWLHAGGVPDAVLCANGSTAALRRYFRANPSSLRVGFQEDETPRGAAGCVKDAAAMSGARTFVVTDGASIPTADIRSMLACHHAGEADLTIAVRMRSATGQQHLEPTGTYVFSRDVLDAVPASSFQDIKENLIPRMYREGRRIELFTVGEVSPRVLDATTYLAANRWMIQRLATDGTSADDCRVHPSAWIDDSATIVGPVIIGPGVRVHAAAIVVGPTSIGAHTIIEEGAVVTRSVTWEHCVVGSGAVVDQSLLADRAAVERRSHVCAAVRTSTVPGKAWTSPRLAWRRSAPSALVAGPVTP